MVRHVLLAQWELFDAALCVPVGQAAAQIALDAGGGLVALLSGLGEQLHNDRRHRAGDPLQPTGRRHRLPRDVAVHPFHRIGRRKG